MDYSRTAGRVHKAGKLRLLVLAGIAVLPSFLKRICYRLFFGYKIGRGVRIGFSIIDAAEVNIGDRVSIGHGNAFISIGRLEIGEHVQVGHLNVVRGGWLVRLGRYCQIIRMNEINSIPGSGVDNCDPRFLLGAGSVITAGHKIDFTDRVEIGPRTTLGGRNSSLWTHTRERTMPIEIGAMCYIGSDIRMAPGTAIPARCIVGMGSVVTKRLTDAETMIAGVPARVMKKLTAQDVATIAYKTRPDLPDDL
jgi:acetyltransferase-like isoleucine patch superfamily enzyme